MHTQKNDMRTSINIMVIYIRDSIVFIDIVFKFLWSFLSIITLIFLCLTIVLPMFFTHHLQRLLYARMGEIENCAWP